MSKRFRLREGTTLKEFLPAFARRKGWSEGFYALRDVSFSVERGDSLGVIGQNGCGKSTLMKLTTGIIVPTAGSISVRGRVSPLIELGAGFHPDFTGRENVFLNGSILGMTNREIQERFDEIVSFADVWPFIDTPVKRYSSGMYVRLAFAVAAHCDPDILIVDELLAVGDAGFQEKCLQRIDQFQADGVTVLFVSHSMPLVRKFCNRALLLDAGSVVAEGDPAYVTQLYTERLGAAELAQAASS